MSRPDSHSERYAIRGHVWKRGWVCDACGTRVVRPEHAVVEWLDPPARPPAPRRGYAVQIAHRRPHGPAYRDCQYECTENFGRARDGVGSRPLSDFLGVDGLTLLLRMLVTGRLQAAEAEELFRRVRLPGYDLVKAHLREAIAAGVLDEESDPRFPTLEEIGQVLDWRSSEDDPGNEVAISHFLPSPDAGG